MLQVELQTEIESTTTAEVTDLNPDLNHLLTSKTSLYKQKCKIWLDIGNLFLFKFSDPHEAFKYFEMVLKTALDTNDLLLNSLTLGNLGLCKQKNGEYETALDYFKEQLLVLDKKLKTLDEAGVLNDLNKKPQHSINIEKLINDDFSIESNSSSSTSSNGVDLLQHSNNIISSNNQIKFNYENIMKIKV
jgi:tetratricopeptide (TPR) repeat protein